MVGNMLKYKCPVCGPNFTHVGGNHDVWKAGNNTIPAHHPLFTYNAALVNTVPEQSTPVAAATPVTAADQGLPVISVRRIEGQGDSLLFSRAQLESKISLFERTSTNPSASTMAEAIHQMLLN